MFPFDHLDPLIFLISLLVGLAYTYFSAPTPQVVLKYPTPFNIRDTVYRDQRGICYKYKIREVPCPSNPKDIIRVIPGE